MSKTPKPLRINGSLFLSIHGLFAVLLLAGLSAWRFMAFPADGLPPRIWLVVSGSTCFALMLLVSLYPLRKFIHKLGWSPEFRWRVRNPDRIENAESRLNQLRLRVQRREITDTKEIHSQARAILKEEGVQRINRVDVIPGKGNRTPEIVVTPTQPLGQMARWTRAHFYYGTAAALLVLLHGNGSFDSPMAFLLTGLAMTILVTGLFGVVMWAIGPSILTRKEQDLTSEAAYALDASLQQKVAVAVAELSPEEAATLTDLERAGQRFDTTARQLTRSLREEEPQQFRKVLDVKVMKEQSRHVRTTLLSLNRVRYLIHGWKWVHTPCAILLLALAIVHILSVLWY